VPFLVIVDNFTDLLLGLKIDLLSDTVPPEFWHHQALFQPFAEAFFKPHLFHGAATFLTPI
jgi:hypothetical protein